MKNFFKTLLLSIALLCFTNIFSHANTTEISSSKTEISEVKEERTVIVIIGRDYIIIIVIN